jgi:hypothetical protein
MTTRSATTTSPRAVLGALALLALSAAVAPASPARADNSRGEGTKALVATIPRDSTGWSNGPANLVPQGGGKYRLEYDTALAGVAGAGHPGVPVVVGNSDGNPIIERLPPRR